MGEQERKKYNLSEIMKKAWELVKGFELAISEGLKKAWKEDKKNTAYQKAGCPATNVYSRRHSKRKTA